MQTRRPASRTIETQTLRPLVMEPVLLPKVWGGDRLAKFGKAVQSGDRIGESWELADLSATSAGGAGGGAVRTRIAHAGDGPTTLHEAIAHWGPALLGDVAPTIAKAGGGNFPLLVKYLDAREDLSVQVHPSIAYCKLHPEAHLKTECWYILDAAPGSVIYKGLKPGVDRAIFAKALRENHGRGVVDLMETVRAVPGECHLLPSGTLHALGAGVLVAEVQTPSDTTFRVYDWGRTGRELHVEEALECIQWERARDATRRPKDQAHATLVTTGFFDLVEHDLAPGGEITPSVDTSRPVVVMHVRGGDLEIRAHERRDAAPVPSVRLALGQTALIPAAISPTTSLRASTPTTLLLAIPR